MKSRRSRIAVLALVALCAVVAVQVADALVDGASGGSVTGVKVRRSDTFSQTNSTSYVDVPGATTTITVPSGQKALLVMTFSGESSCFQTGSADGDWCGIRILVGSTPAAPDSDFAFDSTNDGVDDQPSWESHSIQRSLVANAGTHTVKVQYRTTAADTTFEIDDWHLTVLRSAK